MKNFFLLTLFVSLLLFLAVPMSAESRTQGEAWRVAVRESLQEGGVTLHPDFEKSDRDFGGKQYVYFASAEEYNFNFGVTETVSQGQLIGYLNEYVQKDRTKEEMEVDLEKAPIIWSAMITETNLEFKEEEISNIVDSFFVTLFADLCSNEEKEKVKTIGAYSFHLETRMGSYLFHMEYWGEIDGFVDG